MLATILVVDDVTGNEISGLQIENDVTFTDVDSACGGATMPLTADPQNCSTAATNAIDCVTSARVKYNAIAGQSVPSTGSTFHPTRDPLYWLETFFDPGNPTSQWQAHDPNSGGRMLLASGSPCALNGGGFGTRAVQPLGAGSSLYRYANMPTSADQVHSFTMFATANTAAALEYRVRRVDANNFIALQYLPGTTTFNLVETVAGVPNILATGVFDLTGDGAAGHAFVITLAGNQVTVTDGSSIIGGPFTTAITGNGPHECFWNTAAAIDLGFHANCQATV